MVLGWEGLGTGPVDTSISPSHYEWHHIALTYDYSTVRFYVDGVLTQAIPKSGQNVDASDILRIGSADPGLSGWTGVADEIRISNRVISDFSYVIMPSQDTLVDMNSIDYPGPIATPTATQTATLGPSPTPTNTSTPTPTPIPF